MEPTKFIRIEHPDGMLVGERSYPRTSVVEAPERFADLAIRHKHASPHTGPAYEPEPVEDPPARGRRPRGE